MQPFLENNRGVALVITLTVIALLVAVTFELNRQTRADVMDAALARDQLILSQMIVSGLGVAESVLIEDKNKTEIDSLQEDWADPQKLDQLLLQLPFENGRITLEISDERSRIQVNALVGFPDGREFNSLQKDLWYRFAALMLNLQQDGESLMEEELEPSAVINPIKDWLDSNDDDAITGLNGAENDYYQALDPPYLCRNGPFRQLDELTRVRGITPELFYSLDEKTSGISQYLTVYGLSGSGDAFSFDGRININTADLPVLAAILPIGYEFLAPAIYDYRIEATNGQFMHDLSNPAWYKEVPGCGDIEIDPGLITTSSDLFRIDCQAGINETLMGATIIVKREQEVETGKWYCRVLNWSYN